MFERKFIGICGSLRKNSKNMGMLRCAAENMPKGTALEIADITAIPLYREDMGTPESVKELARQVREVTAERIFDAMKTVTLDTVYFLKGKEAEEA